MNVRMPDFSKNFVLETDASDEAIGGVLKQEDNVIACVSRVLKGPEKNYTITEREILAVIFSMEKLEHILAGREFIIQTDHKAMEEIKSKVDFGTPRIMRWLARLERFNFVINYIKGTELVGADALSRACKEDDSEIKEKVLKIHNDKGHRKENSKEIKNILENKLTEKKIKEIVNTCEICNRVEAKRVKPSSKFVETNFPGEVFAVYLMDVEKKHKVVLGIDYFSRRMFARVINSKEPDKIVSFLEEVKTKLNIKSLFSDNGGEFCNPKVEKWYKDNGITKNTSIPYYHQENGRIERAIRTIRTTIKKLRGPLKMRLKKAIETYNSSVHRGIGMCPLDALKEENFEQVKAHSKKYSKEFKSNELEKFEINDKVFVKNETKKNKMDEEYNKKGTIIEKVSDNGYIVKIDDGQNLRRHSTQLKICRGDVV